MANADYLTTPLLGGRLTAPTTTAEHALGTVAFGNGNTSWIYVQASEAVATGTCTVSAAFALTDIAGAHTADVAFASGEYGWVRQTTVAVGSN